MSEQNVPAQHAYLSSLCRTFMQDGDHFVFRRTAKDLDVIQVTGEADETKKNDLYYALKYKLKEGESLGIQMVDGELVIDEESDAREVSSGVEAKEVPVTPEVSSASLHPAPVEEDDLPYITPPPVSAGFDAAKALEAVPKEVTLLPPSSDSIRDASGNVFGGGTEPYAIPPAPPVDILPDNTQAVFTSSFDQNKTIIDAVRPELELFQRAQEHFNKQIPYSIVVGVPLGAWFVLESNLLHDLLGFSLAHVLTGSALGFFFALTLFFLLLSVNWKQRDQAIEKAQDDLRRALLPSVQAGDFWEHTYEHWVESLGEGAPSGLQDACPRVYPNEIAKKSLDVYEGFLRIHRESQAVVSEVMSWFKWIGGAVGIVAVSHLHRLYGLGGELLNAYTYAVLYLVFVSVLWFLHNRLFTRPAQRAILQRHRSFLEEAPDELGMTKEELAEALGGDAILLMSPVLRYYKSADV